MLIQLGLCQYGTNDFSMSFWIQVPAWGQAQNCVFSKKGNDLTKGIVIYRDGGSPSKARMRIGTGTSVQYNIDTGSNFQNSKWVHWCYVRRNNVGYWYRNGIFDNSGEDYGDVSSDQIIWIGYNQTWTTNAFYNLKALRIYNRALSSDEVAELSNEFDVKYVITASDQVWSSLTPAQMEGYDIVYSCSSTPSFEIISGSLPSSITFNTSTGHFQGQALMDADHTYNLVIRMSGDDIITKDINMTINTSATSPLTVSTPQTFNFITEKTNDVKDISMSTKNEKPSVSISSGTLPDGISIYQQGNGLKISSSGNQTQSAAASVQIAVTTRFHPEPVYATININVSLNQITVADKEINFYTEEASASQQVKYTTQNAITPVYTLSGTLPTGITFDSSTGTFTYDGTTTTPASGSVQVTVSSSTGCSTPDTGTFTLNLIEGSSPIPQGVWLYCPCSDATTFECENSGVGIAKNGSPTFYTAAQEGKDCMSVTSAPCNLNFTNCYSGDSKIPYLDDSRTVVYWIKCPSNMSFKTGHGQSIFAWGYGSPWQDFRNALISNSTSSWENAGISNDYYNGWPTGTLTYGSNDNMKPWINGADTKWHMITISYDSSSKQIKGYMNATLIFTYQLNNNQTMITGQTQQGPLVLGVGSPSKSGHTQQASNPSFRMADFRIWKRALTQNEITKLFNLGLDINVEDRDIKFYIDAGSTSAQVTYTSDASFTPIYSLSGTLPTGITFDSSTGTFTYDGTTTTPASGSVIVGVAPSGTSNYAYGNYSLEIIQGSVPIPTSGLVFYAPLSSTTTTAETGDALTFHASGITAQTYNGIPCLHFPGDKAQYISALDTNMQFGSNINNTLSIWMNTETIKNVWCGIFSYGKAVSQYYQKYIGIFTGDTGQGANAPIEGDYFYANVNSNIPSYNVWHHVCFTTETVGGTSAGKIYIDGEYKGQVTASLTIESHQSSNIFIAQGPDTSSGSSYLRTQGFAGYLAAARIYNRVLTQTEITQLSQEFTPTT